jgi:hypothetical protein
MAHDKSVSMECSGNVHHKGLCKGFGKALSFGSLPRQRALRDWAAAQRDHAMPAMPACPVHRV